MLEKEHVTDHPVPVVRLIVPDLERRVLVLRRKESMHAPGDWCLPGGKVDYGDTIEHTISKELREETSLTCTSSRFLFLQDSLPTTPRGMHCINMYFECAVSGEISLNEESSAFAWIGLSDMQNYHVAFRNDLALLDYWREC